MYLPVRAVVARTRVTVAVEPPIVCKPAHRRGATALVPAEAWVQFPALEIGAAITARAKWHRERAPCECVGHGCHIANLPTASSLIHVRNAQVLKCQRRLR